MLRQKNQASEIPNASGIVKCEYSGREIGNVKQSAVSRVFLKAIRYLDNSAIKCFFQASMVTTSDSVSTPEKLFECKHLKLVFLSRA